MLDYFMELCSPLGRISHRRMFGADCVFVHGTMFAIVEGDEIYIKKPHSDESDVRFGYVRQGKMVYLNYVLIDSGLLDEPEQLVATIRDFLC